jgi:hypothetical protein
MRLVMLLGSFLGSKPQTGVNETQIEAGPYCILNGCIILGTHVRPFAGFAICVKRPD